MDSLVIAGQIELVGQIGGVNSTLPGCQNVKFILDIDYNLGIGQQITDIVSTMNPDGEAPQGTRTANRLMSIPISIVGQDRDSITLARETLFQIINAPNWELTWTRDNGLPFIIECFRVQPTTPVYSLNAEQQNVAQLTLNVPALPFGKSDMPEILNFLSPIMGQPIPPSPFSGDLFATVSPQSPTWVRSGVHVEGSYSCYRPVERWLSRRNSHDQDAYISSAYYSNTFSAQNISALSAVYLRAGFVDPNYGNWWGRNSSSVISITLTFIDATGQQISIGANKKVHLGSDISQPIWKKISLPLPANDTFDFTHVVGYSLLLSNSSDGSLKNCIPFLDALWILPATTLSVPSTRGSVYNLNGIKGSAHAPLRLTIQQAPPLGTSVTLTGAGNWTCPAGITRAQVISTAPGGPGGSISTNVYPAPTPIFLVGSSYGTTGSGNSSSVIAPVPAGTGSGHYMLMYVTQISRNVYCPPGWTQISPNGSQFAVFGRWANNEPVTYTVSLSGSGFAAVSILTYGGTINMLAPVKAVLASSWFSSYVKSAVFMQPAGVAATDVVVYAAGSYDCNGSYTSTPWVLGRTGGAWTSRISSFGTSIGHYGGMGNSYYFGLDYQNVTMEVFDNTGVTGDPTITSNVSTSLYGFAVVLQQGASSTGGGSGGAGETSSENIVALTPGALYAYSAPGAQAPGTDMSNPALRTIFTGDNVTIIANPGRAAIGQAHGAPGQGSSNSNKQPGGSGIDGTAIGAGGPSSGSPAQAGNTPTGSAGALGVAGSGAGGNGGTGPNGAGQAGGAPGAGGGGATYTSGAAQAGGLGGAGSIKVTYYNSPLTTFKTALLHRPGPQSPEYFVPCIPYTGGVPGVQVNVPDPIGAMNARFNGTYSVMVAASAYNAPTTSRVVTVTVTEFDNDAGGHFTFQSVARSFIPNNDALNNLITIGELTLPFRDIPPENLAMSYAVKIDSSNAADRFLDVLLIDTMGQTLFINTVNNWYNQFFSDEPQIGKDTGRVLATATDRQSAVSIIQDAYPTGGTLYVEPGDNILLGYCVEGAPSILAAYNPRGWMDRAF